VLTGKAVAEIAVQDPAVQVAVHLLAQVALAASLGIAPAKTAKAMELAVAEQDLQIEPVHLTGAEAQVRRG
jgi:hypothetical protein